MIIYMNCFLKTGSIDGSGLSESTISESGSFKVSEVSQPKQSEDGSSKVQCVSIVDLYDDN